MIIADDDGGWWAFATNGDGANIQTFRSTDLVTWEQAPDALPQLPLASADVFEGVSSKFGDIEAQFNLAYNGHANWAAAYRS